MSSSSDSIPEELYTRIKDVLAKYYTKQNNPVVWKCVDCYHANKGTPGAPCYWCGSLLRTPLFPVNEANMQQNTADYDSLISDIDREEANRTCNASAAEQIRQLLAEFYHERTQITPPAGVSAEEPGE